jgi:hypothetical protein
MAGCSPDDAQDVILLAVPFGMQHQHDAGMGVC